MPEHMSESWACWGDITSYFQTLERPIAWDDLSQGLPVDGHSVSDLSQELWSFTCRHIGGRVYERHNTFCTHISGNGFEPWRTLYLDYEGTSELIAANGQSKLLSFPQRNNYKQLNAHLHDRLHIAHTFGTHMRGNAINMHLFNVLPDKMRTTIFEHREPKHDGLRELVGLTRQQTTWTQQTHLASMTDPQHNISALRQRHPRQPKPAVEHAEPPPAVHAKDDGCILKSFINPHLRLDAEELALMEDDNELPDGPPPQLGAARKLPSLRVTRPDLTHFGYYGGCLRCADIQLGYNQTTNNHNDACRRRMCNAM